MNDILGFVAVPAVTVLCMLIAQGAKVLFKRMDTSAIPILCAICGLVLATAAYVTIPGFIPADNWLVASAIGVVSGFAATGVHQVYKQAAK